VVGRVNYLHNYGEVVFKQWPQGAYFGEIEMITGRKRICSASAAETCDFFTLNKKLFLT